MFKFTLFGALALLGAAGAIVAPAPALQVIRLTLKDHRFTPDMITIPAGQRIKIDLTNEDATADDFDSDDLHVDKDVGPHGRVAFLVGPLTPGTYAFKGELHAATAHGTVVVTQSGQ